MSEAHEHLTQKQYDDLKAELAELEGPRRREVVQSIKTAREFGDLSENFEYHAAKNEQGLLEARIRTLRHRLDHAAGRLAMAGLPSGQASVLRHCASVRTARVHDDGGTHAFA